MQDHAKVQKAIEFIRNAVPEISRDRLGTGVVLGSGLGDWEPNWEEIARISYIDIPDFPRSTVPGHDGELVFGRAVDSGRRLVCLMKGRFHLYEGYTPAESCQGVRLMAGLGMRTLVLTNAAGALNPLFSTGNVMVITDHINLTGASPLTGPNIDAWGPRFPDMSRVYCPRLAGLALKTGTELGLRLEQGVYVGVPGPALETPAETRTYRRLGGDAIGMSTVLEAICAHHMRVGVLGLSCLTNKNLPDCMTETSLEEILEQAGRASKNLGRIVNGFLRKIDHPEV
ncbi:MAG: purine-nucleoside phosphorylase [Deltaproteobacteria bacterium]|nr:purine-nucleoside phosphorylase [Deltaproteobacteria bacterium]